MLQKYIPKTAYVKAEQFACKQEQIEQWHIRVSVWKGKTYYWLPIGDFAEKGIKGGQWIVLDPEFDDGYPFVMSNTEFKRTYEKVN